MENNKFKIGQHFIKLLLLYILLLFVFLSLYVFSVLVSDYKLDKDKYSVELTKTEDECKSVLDSILNSSQSIANRVNYSLSFRDPYIQLLSGGELSVKDRTTIIQELRSAYAWSGNKDIEEVVLFVDNSDIALSASGIVQLEEPFQHVSFPTAYMETTNISDLLGVESTRFTFSDSNIIYLIGFRYQGGNDRGVLCISFNKDKVFKKLESILSRDSFTLLFAGNTLLSNRSEVEKSEKTVSSTSNQKLRLILSIPPYKWNGPDANAFVSIIAGLVLFTIILVIYLVSRYKYTESLKKIRNLIPYKEGIQDDEFESMLNDLKGVLLENNSYKETLNEVGEYVERGFFSSDHDQFNDSVMRYLGFVKPYYLVLAINVDGEEGELDKVLLAIRESSEDEEISISCFKRDSETALVFINSDTIPDEEKYTDIFYKVGKVCIGNESKITIGVDIPRQDVVELRLSISEALSALKLMLVRGKDDIYFTEDKEDDKCEYYMIPSFDVQIASSIRDEDRDKLFSMFDSLLRTNLMKYDLTPSSVFALSDELYYIELKVLRSLSLGREIKAQKPSKYLTIEEIIEFYRDLFISFIDTMEKEVESEDDNYKELLEYVDINFADPNISLKMLGTMFDLSTKSIGNYFSLKYHMTYLEYVTKKRIEKAINLLKDDALSIDDISRLSGYSSALSFRRNFKDITGVTPSEYRSRDNSLQ